MPSRSSHVQSSRGMPIFWNTSSSSSWSMFCPVASWITGDQQRQARVVVFPLRARLGVHRQFVEHIAEQIAAAEQCRCRSWRREVIESSCLTVISRFSGGVASGKKSPSLLSSLSLPADGQAGGRAGERLGRGIDQVLAVRLGVAIARSASICRCWCIGRGSARATRASITGALTRCAASSRDLGFRCPVTDFVEDYQPGDIVTYHSGRAGRTSQSHIAIVAECDRAIRPADDRAQPRLGSAARGRVVPLGNITGHYRFSGARRSNNQTGLRSTSARSGPAVRKRSAPAAQTATGGSPPPLGLRARAAVAAALRHYPASANPECRAAISARGPAAPKEARGTEMGALLGNGGRRWLLVAVVNAWGEGLRLLMMRPSLLPAPSRPAYRPMKPMG